MLEKKFLEGDRDPIISMCVLPLPAELGETDLGQVILKLCNTICTAVGIMYIQCTRNHALEIRFQN